MLPMKNFCLYFFLKMRGGPLLVGCCRKRVRGEQGRDKTRTLPCKKTKSAFKNQNTGSRE